VRLSPATPVLPAPKTATSPYIQLSSKDYIRATWPSSQTFDTPDNALEQLINATLILNLLGTAQVSGFLKFYMQGTVYHKAISKLPLLKYIAIADR
jgi:hypothetical protein